MINENDTMIHQNELPNWQFVSLTYEDRNERVLTMIEASIW